MDLERICEIVARRETPSLKEERAVLKVAEWLMDRIREEALKGGLEVEVSLEGSLAKGTWLKTEPEIDIFIHLPPSFPREEFGGKVMEISKRATSGFRSMERYAEHPYLEAFVEGYRVNIVPCYIVEKGSWLSATDRTRYHTLYVKERLSDEGKREVRLLKRFMRGIGAYGAEIKTGGFSGYLCELLIIYYGSFINTLSAASKWRSKELLDLEGYYPKTEEAFKLFGERLIFIDPVDKFRNVAAGVREDKKSIFTVASRVFIKKPRIEFFYPPKIKPLSPPDLKRSILRRGSTLIFIKFLKDNVVPDIIWGQLFKAEKALFSLLERYGFKPIKSAVWSDERKLHIFLLEVESHTLPNIVKHIGPPVSKMEHSENFLKKHLKAEDTISGPTVEGDRWIVYKKRKYTDAVGLLKDNLRDGGRSIGVPEGLADALKLSMEFYLNMEIFNLYNSNLKFAEFLTEYLRGRPNWLE